MANIDTFMPDISLEGFQVVRGQYFARPVTPTMTIWETGISFNSEAFASLVNCEAIQILINDQKRCIIIKPTSSKETDAVAWRRGKDSTPKYSKFECGGFAGSLMQRWGWDKNIRYRSYGHLVQCDKKVMLLYDFTDPERWQGKSLVKDDE